MLPLLFRHKKPHYALSKAHNGETFGGVIRFPTRCGRLYLGESAIPLT